MFSVFLSAVRRHLGREANTSGVRQARVQQQPHIHQHLYGEYLVAMEKAQWGEGGGAGGSQGHSVQAFDGCFEANLWDSLARNGPRAPAPTPQSVEVIQWGYSVTTMRKEREHGSTVTSPGERGLSSRSPQQSLPNRQELPLRQRRVDKLRLQLFIRG